MFADLVQRRARWKFVAVGAQKNPNNGRRVVKSARRRLAEIAKKNPKNTETDRKVIEQNTKTNTGMEEAGEEEKGRGALGLGTSSKLLEPSAKGMWGVPPPLQLWCSGRVEGWRLAIAKKP